MQPVREALLPALSYPKGDLHGRGERHIYGYPGSCKHRLPLHTLPRTSGGQGHVRPVCRHIFNGIWQREQRRDRLHPFFHGTGTLAQAKLYLQQTSCPIPSLRYSTVLVPYPASRDGISTSRREMALTLLPHISSGYEYSYSTVQVPYTY